MRFCELKRSVSITWDCVSWLKYLSCNWSYSLEPTVTLEMNAQPSPRSGIICHAFIESILVETLPSYPWKLATHAPTPSANTVLMNSACSSTKLGMVRSNQSFTASSELERIVPSFMIRLGISLATIEAGLIESLSYESAPLFMM